MFGSHIIVEMAVVIDSLPTHVAGCGTAARAAHPVALTNWSAMLKTQYADGPKHTPSSLIKATCRTWRCSALEHDPLIRKLTIVTTRTVPHQRSRHRFLDRQSSTFRYRLIACKRSMINLPTPSTTGLPALVFSVSTLEERLLLDADFHHTCPGTKGTVF